MGNLATFLMLNMLKMMESVDYGQAEIISAVGKKHNPWDGVHLTKTERKGKTYEEQQELRREKYEANHER